MSDNIWIDINSPALTKGWGQKFEYMGHTGNPAHCLIKRNGNVVICTEAPDNHGESITNAAEIIATRYCLLHNLPMDKLVWIEHYIHMGEKAGEEIDRPTFDIVVFSIYNGSLTRPQWKPTNKWRAMVIYHKGGE
jgi:hypothetical protein